MKKTQQKLLYLPDDYSRKSLFTVYLQKRRRKDILICWYIGNETGRLFGIYWNRQTKETTLKAYDIKKDGLFEHYITLQVVHANEQPKSEYCIWGEIQDRLRKSPEVYCTEYMEFYLGIGIDPSMGNYGKVIPFPKVTIKETTKDTPKAKAGMARA